MTLKEQIAADLEDGAVWFNEDDFAAWHEINGARVLCIMGCMENGAEKIGRLTGGVDIDSSSLFIRAREFTRRPKTGESIDIDGTRYRICKIGEDLGVYVIEYRRYDDAKIRSSGP